jgi:hypothetical protein
VFISVEKFLYRYRDLSSWVDDNKNANELRADDKNCEIHSHIPIKTLCFLQTAAAKMRARLVFARARADEPTTGFLHTEKNNKNADAERECGYSFALLETQQPKIIRALSGEFSASLMRVKDCFLTCPNKSGEI